MIAYPAYPKQLVLVRHGQSLLNVIHAKSPSFFETREDKERFKDLPDHKVGLSALGHEQATKTGRALFQAGYRFTDVLDTGYERTVETLDHILEAYPDEEKEFMTRQHDLSLRERENGYSYSLIKKEMETHFPWMQEYWKTVGPVLARPIGGESIADVITRVQLGLGHIFQATEDKKVLIAMHGRVLASIRYLLEDWSLGDLEKYLQANDHKNCGVTVYNYAPDKKRLILKEYNTCYW
jgi:broad specificity phosphatase PhoE